MGGLSWEGPIGSCSIKVILVFSNLLAFLMNLVVCVCVHLDLLVIKTAVFLVTRLAKFSDFYLV